MCSLGTGVIIARNYRIVNPFFEKSLKIFNFSFGALGLKNKMVLFIIKGNLLCKVGDVSWRATPFLLDSMSVLLRSVYVTAAMFDNRCLILHRPPVYHYCYAIRQEVFYYV